MRTLSSLARQTTAVFLSGPDVTAPMTASTTATSKAAVSACVSADVFLHKDRALIKTGGEKSGPRSYFRVLYRNSKLELHHYTVCIYDCLRIITHHLYRVTRHIIL